jgi:class 3 adenylate cyclase/tetratricopeptide (TPR) repeat protein
VTPDAPLLTSEGERKVVTVLFADVVGSSKHGHNYDDEEFRDFLDGCLAQMVGAVTASGGTVARVQGDGIMALFGAPIAHEDHAVRACLAALRLRDAFSHGRATTHHQFPVQARVGLHTGEAIVRSLESEHSRDYDAVGKAVYLAARMEQLCEPGSILLTADVVAHTGGFFETVPIATKPIKGTDEQIDLFRLIGQRAGTAARFADQDVPLVGRRSVLARFDELLAGLRAGRFAVHRIEGEAGYGKTRLFQEFARRASAQQIETVEVRGYSHMRGVPYATVSSLFLDLLKRQGNGPLDLGDEALGRRLEAIGIADPIDRAAVLGLFGIDAKATNWDSLNPSERRVRLLGALDRLWRCLVRDRACLLLLEDLHWMDQTCLEVYGRVIGAARHSPLLVIASHRPTVGQLPGAFEKELTHLDPLSPLETRQMIELASGGQSISQGTLERISTRSAGVPFYVRELLSDYLARTKGPEVAMPGHQAVSSRAEVPSAEIPLAIEASILARIDSLPERSKRIAQTLAVVGPTSDSRVLESACDLSQAELDASALSLSSARLVQRVEGTAGVQYAFVHEITRDVCLRSILRSTRRSLHANVFRAIKSVWREHVDEARRVHALAHHAEQAELWEEALANLAKACSLAVKSSAVEEAVRLYARARHATSKIKDRDTRIERIDLRLLVFPAFLTIGELDQMRQALEEAAGLAQEIGDSRRHAIATAQLATAQWMSGDHVAAIASSESVLAITDKTKHLPLWLHSVFTLANAHHGRGDLIKAIEGHRLIVHTLEGLGLESAGLRWAGIPSVMSRAFLCWFLIEKGDFAEARAHIDRGSLIANQMQQPYARVLIRLGEGLYYFRRGDAETAVPILESTLRLCQEFAVFAEEAINAAWLASALVMAGRPGEALSIAEDSYKRNTHLRGGKYNWFYLFKAIGEAKAGLGQLDDGMAWVDRAIAVARETKEAIHHAQGLKCRGDIRLGRPQLLASAIDDFKAALALAEKHCLAPLAAECQLSLSTANTALGRCDEAQAYLTRASAGFAALGLERFAQRERRLPT